MGWYTRKFAFVGAAVNSQGTLCYSEYKVAHISRKLSQSLRAPHAPLTPPSSTFDEAVNHFCLLLHRPGRHLHKTENALKVNKENRCLMYLKEYKEASKGMIYCDE